MCGGGGGAGSPKRQVFRPTSKQPRGWVGRLNQRPYIIRSLSSYRYGGWVG